MASSLVEQQKNSAALKAVELIESGMTIGLGTGTTAQFAIIEIAKRIEDGVLKNIECIPSSLQTKEYAEKLKIDVVNFEQNLVIDINIDGADEVDSDLNLIKGGGGALLREKVVAQASKRNVVIVDESKLSDNLGEKWPVPIEVLPFAWKLEQKYLESEGAKVKIRENSDGGFFETDQGNYILDSNFGTIHNPGDLCQRLSIRAGIMEHGLFFNTTTDLIIGTNEGVLHKST